MSSQLIGVVVGWHSSSIIISAARRCEERERRCRRLPAAGQQAGFQHPLVQNHLHRVGHSGQSTHQHWIQIFATSVQFQNGFNHVESATRPIELRGPLLRIGNLPGHILLQRWEIVHASRAVYFFIGRQISRINTMTLLKLNDICHR